MSTDAETLADRRRLRRKLSFWRVLGVLALIAAVAAIGFTVEGRTGWRAGPQIARVSIGGFISGDQRMSDLLRRVGESASVSGVVISINSPGGSVTGAEELFQNIRALAAKKPTVAFVDGTAASGGYLAAIGTDHIVARQTSLVGSIGVLLQYPDVSSLLGKLGVAVEEVKSTPLKAAPNPFRPPSPEARAVLQEVVDDTHQWFRAIVAERRNLTPEQVDGVATGRVFNGRQSVALRLVDGVGDARTAIGWLERERGVTRDLPVRNWRPRGGRDFDLLTAAGFGLDLLGFDRIAESLHRASRAADIAKLDGLLAIWHPALENQ